MRDVACPLQDVTDTAGRAAGGEDGARCPPERARPRCHRPWTGFELVDHLGDVRPCCWGKVSCGNINEQTPREIWEGAGFRLYREAMLRDELDRICNPACPILQGQYEEDGAAPSARSPEPFAEEAALPPTATPRYLRVVPTTKCNLRCPMCYQHADPPPRLPPGWTSLFDGWLPDAAEFLVLGGEPFLPRTCLEWIEKLDPERYPRLGLAAITNGLGFSPAVCELIGARRWNWILVSMDAATPGTYRKVRGGDFGLLRAGLERLAAVRARHEAPFELRFGFTLQNSNLDDALPFLSLCDEFRAVPQYTVVFGNWHGESPVGPEAFSRFLEVLERLDKELFARGFDDSFVAGAVARLESHAPAPRLGPPPFARAFYAEPGTEGGARTERVVRSMEAGALDVILPRAPDGREALRRVLKAAEGSAADVTVVSPGEVDLPADPRCEARLEIPAGAGAAECANAVARLAGWCGALGGSRPRLLLRLDPTMAVHWKSIRAGLSSIPAARFSIELPYHLDGVPVSALEWRELVEDVKRFGAEAGWTFAGGRPAVVDLGLRPDDQLPAEALVYRSRARRDVALSVIVPVRNRARQLPAFLASLRAQRVRDAVELVLVDDGSDDGSERVALEAVGTLAGCMDLLLLRLERRPGRGEDERFRFRAGVARQAGLAHARGTHVLFVDPDQVVSADCLAQHVLWQSRGFDVVVGDRGIPALPAESPEARGRARLRFEPLRGEPHWWLHFSTGNSSVRRSLLDFVGGFDCSLQYWGLDDTDLGYRLHRAGGRYWHTPRASVTHLPDAPSAGGSTQERRLESYRIHMEVLYRKYLDPEILDAHEFVWDQSPGPAWLRRGGEV